MATPFKENILLLNYRHRGKLRSVLNVIVQRSIVGATMESRAKPCGSRGGIFGEQSRSGASFRSLLYGTHLQLQSYSLLIYYGTGIASQVQRLTTGWTVWVSNPGGGKRYSLLNICPDSRWVSHSLLYYGYPTSFVGV